MRLIREIVQEAEKTGYLTLQAEDQLRQLLANKYDWEDFTAFIQLQQSVMEQRVKQESRELLYTLSGSTPTPCHQAG
ncbi:MAG: hypothetical protein RIE73_32130 [Coleofasciculus sp. C1-SOL-03]|uniref:hypothetical protein n=1 Tax=Coleofasciculus sp. C1-SOL-03 TaxID=3069522 RepID=UPI0032F68734